MEQETPTPTANSYYVAPNELSPFSVIISAMDYGYQVKVGCKTLAISDKEVLKAKLIEYLDAPKETQEKFLAGTLFS